MNLKDQRVCEYCHGKSIKRIYKFFLDEVEQLRDEGSISEAQFQSLRKDILDISNAQIRDVKDFLEQYRILSYKDGDSEFTNIATLSEHISKDIARMMLEWKQFIDTEKE